MRTAKHVKSQEAMKITLGDKVRIGKIKDSGSNQRLTAYSRSGSFVLGKEGTVYDVLWSDTQTVYEVRIPQNEFDSFDSFIGFFLQDDLEKIG